MLAFFMTLGFAALAEGAANGDALVVCSSCTGTTEGVAEKLAAVSGADLYEIVPAEPYTAGDLNCDDRSAAPPQSRTIPTPARKSAAGKST